MSTSFRASRRLLASALLPGAVLLPGCDQPTALDHVVAVRFDVAVPALMEGDTTRFSASAVDRHGSALRNVTMQWHSTDTTVATVDGSGLVTAKRPGSASIVARAGAHADTAVVAVTPAPHTVSVATELRLLPGDVEPVDAVVLDPRGDTIPGVVLDYRSSDSTVVTVDAAGMAHAHGFGTAFIDVQAAPATARIRVDVFDPADCRTVGGTTHSGTITSDTTWRRRAGPHRIPVRLEVASRPALPSRITIEAGTAVCFGTDAELFLGPDGGLIAVGTEHMSIHFLPDTSGGTWSMVAGHPFIFHWQRPVTLRHVHMRGGDATLMGDVQFDSATVRGGGPIQVGGTVRIADSLIEDATVTMRDGTLTYERSIIRRGSLVLHSFGARAEGRLLSGRIEDSPGIGLQMVNDWRRIPQIVEYGMLRIVGSDLYPANITAQAASLMLATQAHQDSLLGNARDTLVVWGETGSDVTIRPGLPWKAVHDFSLVVPGLTHRVGVHGGATLRMEPGAVLIGGIYASDGNVVAIGTAEDPVVIRDPNPRTRNVFPVGAVEGSLFFGASADARQSVIRHAELHTTSLTADGAHALVIDSSRIVGGSIVLRAAGSRISSSRFERSDSTAAGALNLAAADLVVSGTAILDSPRNGVVIAADGVRMHDCHIEGSAAAGVLVEAGAGIRVNDCNLVRNGGPGVENRTADEVDATLNWWGHVDGAAAGDGAAGAVRTVPHRTAPAATLSSPIRL